MKYAMKAVVFVLFSVLSVAKAHNAEGSFEIVENFQNKPILADLKDLQALGIPVLASSSVGVGYAVIDPQMQAKLHHRAHAVGKCGGFEDLSHDLEFFSEGISSSLKSLEQAEFMQELYVKAPFKAINVAPSLEINSALSEVSEDNLRSVVTWLSSFPTRDSRSSDPNRHVGEMKLRLEALLAESSVPYEIHEISHQSTRQNTLHVRLTGKERPQEIVVLGGHLDSTASSWGGGGNAPGADDNASGSANLVEALRILMKQKQSARTIDFFWYAGEEQGLLGSAEIARDYKAQKKDVIAVLQLDMTLFPGSGDFVIGSMTDFTSAWLRDYLKAINTTYLNAKVVDDKCGYGCSDHASWHRQGFPALMPFEATFSKSNRNIHTVRDVISPAANFKHSAMYTKIALIMAMDLGNSLDRQPF